MRLFEIYKKHQEGINYLIFGFLATVLTLAVYYISTLTFLDASIPLQLQIANVVSWIAGFLFAYFTNRLFVFKSENKQVGQEFLKFFASRLFTLFLDMIIMYVFVSMLKFDNRIIKLFSQLVVIVSNYILSKLIVFKKDKMIK